MEVAVAEFDVSLWRLPEETRGNSVIPQDSQSMVQHFDM
jgi:hypothetical protein